MTEETGANETVDEWSWGASDDAVEDDDEPTEGYSTFERLEAEFIEDEQDDGDDRSGNAEVPNEPPIDRSVGDGPPDLEVGDDTAPDIPEPDGWGDLEGSQPGTRSSQGIESGPDKGRPERTHGDESEQSGEHARNGVSAGENSGSRSRGILSTSFTDLIDTVLDTSASAETSRPSAATPGPSEDIERVFDRINSFGRAASAPQVLLVSPTNHSITDEVYSRALTPADTAGQNVLFVTATGSPGDRLSVPGEVADWTDGNTALIEVGQGGTPPRLRESRTEMGDSFDVHKRVSDPTNVAKLGVITSHVVSQWKETNQPTVLGFHTLSYLHRYVGTETVFRFLHILQAQLDSLDIMGYYHLDPADHEEHELRVLDSLFDMVVTVTADGSIEID